MSPTGMKPMDPSTRFVRSLEGQYFMLREAAQMLEVSHRTLRRLIESTKDLPDVDKLGPSFCTHFGKVQIYLYTLADVERIRAHMASSRKVVPFDPEMRRPRVVKGRPRKWSTDQRKERDRLYSRINYYRRRIAELELEGTAAGLTRAAKAQAQVDRAEAELRQMEGAA